MNELIPLIVLGVAILILLAWILLLELRLKRLFRGQSARSLEVLMEENQKRISQLYEKYASTEARIADLDARMRKKIVSAKTLRFNPFQGTGVGGNQSFASAFLDEDGDGVVLSTLYSREKVSIFGKPVIARSSEYELTEEERSVLK